MVAAIFGSVLVMQPGVAHAGKKAKAENWCADYKRSNPGKDCQVVRRGTLCPKGFRREAKFGGPLKGYKTCIQGRKGQVIKKALKKPGKKAEAENWCADYKRNNPGKDCQVVHRGVLCPKGYRREARFGGPARGYKACIEGRKGHVIKQGLKKAGNAVAGATMKGPVLQGYKHFFSNVRRLASGPIKLDDKFRRKYQRYFKNDLRSVTIYTSSGVAGRNAMTDCKTIYFPKNAGVYRKLKARKPLSTNDKRWLFHELAHTEQCKKAGGRNNYALKWFSSLPVGMIKGIKGKKGTQFADRIHKKMPMESAAERKAQRLKSI